MEIYTYPDIHSITTPVVTVGTFDGIHAGHRELLNCLKKYALKQKGHSVVVTLWPHPRIVLGNIQNDFKLLNSLEEKIRLLTELKIDYLIIIPFTEEFSRLSAEEFIKRILVDALKVKCLLLGPDNYYGYNRESGYRKIEQIAGKYCFDVVIHDVVFIGGERVSSTLIRKQLQSGDIRKAGEYLGYHYILSGIVIKGDGIGKSLGYPTANLQIEDSFKLIPPDGVYAVKVQIENNIYDGMLYIGERPTLKKNNKNKNIEVHLFNFAGTLYGQKLYVSFIDRIRNNIRFENLEALKKQIDNDKITVQKLIHNK